MKRGLIYRWLLRIAAAAVVLYAGFFAFAWFLMTRPPQQFARAMGVLETPTFLLLPFETMWFRARAGTLHPGDAAPDFHLPSLDKREKITLSSFRGVKPVVLIFGSYT